jgi:hypothetical protein
MKRSLSQAHERASAVPTRSPASRKPVLPACSRPDRETGPGGEADRMHIQLPFIGIREA